jgi:hypothetical protein
VAGLVVVDPGVALDEARQEVVLLEIGGDESKRGQAQGGLEDQVVDGDEADLGGRIVR